MEPISSVTIYDNQKIVVRIPSDQTIYFDEYLIYYRIYPSTFSVTHYTSHAQANSHINRITSANENPATIESVLSKELSYKTMNFALLDNAEIATYTNNPLRTSNIEENNFSSFIIDFNISINNYPVLEIGTDRYRLVRNDSLDLKDNKKDYFYYNDITAETILKQDLDYWPPSNYSRDDYPFAYVMLIAVASGHDYNYSKLHSTATQLGFFELAAK